MPIYLKGVLLKKVVPTMLGRTKDAANTVVVKTPNTVERTIIVRTSNNAANIK